MLKAATGLALLPLAFVVLLAGAQADEALSSPPGAVNLAALPPLAQQLAPTVLQVQQQTCPALPPAWIFAQVQVESGWVPTAYSSAGAAGLYQLLLGSWVDAGGEPAGWTAVARPPDGHPVWDPKTHLATAIPWVCDHLRSMTQHVAATRKPIEPLDAMAVCHIAGCSRVTSSAKGIPAPGEAGCNAACVAAITDYLDAIHRYVDAYSAPAGFPANLPPAPAPYTGGSTGCSLPDPTGTGGCVTAATAWLIGQINAAFGPLPVSCWDAHAWNPSSDHPKGQACDYVFGTLGSFPGPADVTRGWLLAEWLRAYAAPLAVKYVIWQGKFWGRGDADWSPYSGGGVYDPRDPTGGHYDHVHVSLTT